MIPAIDTAYYKYLKRLEFDERVRHLIECGQSGGELYYELAEEFDEYDPVKLALLIEDK